MNQEMVPRFTAFPAHVTLASHTITPPHQIITSKNFPPCCCPHKKGYPPRSLDPPNGLPGKSNISLTTEDIVKRLGIKSAMMPKIPPQSIKILICWGFRMNESEEVKHLIHLPIIKIPSKSKIPSTVSALN